MSFRFQSALIGLAATAAFAAAQTSVYDSGGFESPFVAGNLNGQQGFAYSGGLSAGRVQTAVTFGGTAQAAQIRGTSLSTNIGLSGGNFYYQFYGPDAGYQPVASGTPFVQVGFQGNTSGALGTPSDIPFAGVYLEGYTAGGSQQSLTPVMMNLNGGVTVFTTENIGGNNKAVSTADGLLTRENWHGVKVELNFAAQTMRLYLFGSNDPVAFTQDGDGGAMDPLFDVPFRNSFGPTVRIAEIGLIGFHAGDPQPPQNNVYIDDFKVTASLNSFAPVPEPGLLLVGAAGVLWLRRRR